jgi:hypothetical protein
MLGSFHFLLIAGKKLKKSMKCLARKTIPANRALKYDMKFPIGLCCLSALAIAGACSHAQKEHVKIDFRSGAGDIDSRDWKLTIGGKHFACVTKGGPPTQPAVVDDQEMGKALRIELDPATGPGPDNGRDKINYTVIKGNNADAPTFNGRMTYFKFALKLDPSEFETPTTGRDYVLAQWWQGAPFGPPLSLQLSPSENSTDTPRYEFAVRNNQTGANPHAKVIELKPHGSDSLERGKWYKFEVGVRPGFNNDGELQLWVNGQEELTWKGNIGYDPSSTARDLGYKTGSQQDRQPNQGLELYIGPYRDRMPSKQVFYYADISYGDER